MWYTTKDGKHMNTDWFDKDRQIAMNKAEADERKEPDYKSINPNYNPNSDKQYDAYSWNCTKCVIALEAAYRGKNVEAKPFEFGSDADFNHNWYKAFGLKRSDGWDISGKTTKDLTKEIELDMEDWGVGSRAALGFKWGKAVAGNANEKHVIMVVQKADGTHYIDPQAGKEIKIGTYLNKAVKSNIGLYRIDDATFNDEMYKRAVKEK